VLYIRCALSIEKYVNCFYAQAENILDLGHRQEDHQAETNRNSDKKKKMELVRTHIT
jgi:hypothetical protein